MRAPQRSLGITNEKQWRAETRRYNCKGIWHQQNRASSDKQSISQK
jgi:hypothetical protein